MRCRANVFHESWRVFPFFHTHILNTCTARCGLRDAAGQCSAKCLQVMGDDIPENGGPGFIWTKIAKQSVTLPDGSKALELRSQTMRTPRDFPVPGSVGYHFCKLVSPAWFMDYIYTDGIRPH